MRYSRRMKKTTVNLDDKAWLLLRARARREGKSLTQVINDLVAAAFPAAYASPTYVGAFEGEVEDLGINAEKYLREGFR